MDKLVMNDEKMLEDVLRTQKATLNHINLFATETNMQELHAAFVEILNQIYQMQYETYLLMKKKGWYPTEDAEQDKINKAKQNFKPL